MEKVGSHSAEDLIPYHPSVKISLIMLDWLVDLRVSLVTQWPSPITACLRRKTSAIPITPKMSYAFLNSLSPGEARAAPVSMIQTDYV